MQINQLITPDRVQCLSGISSKKRALESLSLLLGSGVVGIDPTEIFHQLIERERLGSTGLGYGVALPHGRLATSNSTSRDRHPSNNSSPITLEVSLGCFIKLDQGIDFDSPDDRPADLLFALLVPEQCTDEHLQILAALARMFSDTKFCDQLRNCQTNEELYAQLSSWQQAHQVAS